MAVARLRCKLAEDGFTGPTDIPDSLESAQYSIPFCLAAGAMDGQEALLPMESGLLCRKDVVELARKASLHVDPALDPPSPGPACD